TVLPEPNEAPVAVADSYEVTEKDDRKSGVEGRGLANDEDPEGDDLTAVLVDNVESGSLDFEPDGSFTYTPQADFTGEDSFTYYATDGEEDSDTVTVIITVLPEPNEAPVAVADSYEVTEK